VRLVGHVDGGQRLRQGADLVGLDEDGIGNVLVDAFPQDLRVGHEQVIADELDFLAEGLREDAPALPIALAHPVFNGDDGYFPARSARYFENWVEVKVRFSDSSS